MVREILKKYKRLSPSSQSANLVLVINALNDYIPYLCALDAGLKRQNVHDVSVSVDMINMPLNIEWRPTLSASPPGREQPRINIGTFEYEFAFCLSTLGMAYFLQARAILQPLFVTSLALPEPDQRTRAIQMATQHLLEAASVYVYLGAQIGSLPEPPACVDVSTAVVNGMASIALAEATSLAVFKDDPYPTVAAQERNIHDREWMYKAPTIPKVRAHLYARLCLAASDHATKAYSLCASAGKSGGTKVDEKLLKYMEDASRTYRAKACRFFGIGADLGGQTGTAIAWLHAGLAELGVARKDGDEKKKGLSFSRLRREWSEKKEDKRVEKSGHWGADGGMMEEIRVLEMLEAKFMKENNTMNTQSIPPVSQLLAEMPSGREIHVVKEYKPPAIEGYTLKKMEEVPVRADVLGESSSDEEPLSSLSLQSAPIGAYPDTNDNNYSRSSSTAYF